MGEYIAPIVSKAGRHDCWRETCIWILILIIITTMTTIIIIRKKTQQQSHNTIQMKYDKLAMRLDA